MLSVKEINGLHRIVDEKGEVAIRTRDGKPCDGGGHADPEKARRQCGYINIGIDRKKSLESAT